MKDYFYFMMLIAIIYTIHLYEPRNKKNVSTKIEIRRRLLSINIKIKILMKFIQMVHQIRHYKVVALEYFLITLMELKQN
jgi:hypothetical protein